MSHDLAAIPDACAHAGNMCLSEHYIYRSHTISWLFVRIRLIQSNRILLSHLLTPIYTYLIRHSRSIPYRYREFF